MNKKFVLLTTVVLTMGLLAGCGKKDTSGTDNDSKATGNATITDASEFEEITVSEMLENVLKENGGKVYIYNAAMNKNTIADRLTLENEEYAPLSLKVYDGANIKEISNKDLGLKLMNPKYAEMSIAEMTNKKVADTGEETESFAVTLARWVPNSDMDNMVDEYLVSIREEDAYIEQRVRFGSGDFFHIIIGEDSYMVFDQKESQYRNVAGKAHEYLLIKDTTYTIDKKVISDTNLDESDKMSFSESETYFPVK